MSIKTISVFGDSLVYGMGDSQEGGWVSRLQEKLRDKAIFWNFGIPGDTSEDLLGRIQEELKGKKPDMAIVFIGANDSQYKDEPENTIIKPKQYEENLRKISEAIKKYTNEIIFIGLPKMNESITMDWKYIYSFCNNNLSQYDKVIKDFSEQNDFKYIPLFDLLENEDLNDGAHPNPNGYQKITKRVESFLSANSLI